MPLWQRSIKSQLRLLSSGKKIKDRYPDILLIADLALDPFTDHGHDGILDSSGNVDNDLTVEALCKSAVIAADSGFDIVAPSDMMDGRVGQIRHSLDSAGFEKFLYLLIQRSFVHLTMAPFGMLFHPHRGIPLINQAINLTHRTFVRLCWNWISMKKKVPIF